MRGVTITLAAGVLLSACATRPESIHASYVSHEKFTQFDCTELNTRMVDTRAELDKFSKLQDGKANADAVGVFLLGIPFSKLSGDHEADVSRLKGEIEALETAQSKVGCRGGAQNRQQAQAATSGDLEGRLRVLVDLKQKGLIGEDEFAARKQLLIDSAMSSVGTAAAAPILRGAAGAPSTSGARPGGVLNGLKVTLRDVDQYSGALVAETDMLMSQATADGYEFNGGAIVLDRRGGLKKGTLPGPYLVGAVNGNGGTSTLASLNPGGGNPPAEVRLSVAREDVIRVVGGEDIPVLRVRLDGFSPHGSFPAGGGIVSGAAIDGEMLVEPNTGLMLSAKIASRSSAYALDRHITQVRR